MKTVISLLLLSVISSVTAFNWQDGSSNAKWSTDCDFYGSDIGNVPNSPGNQCSTNCANNAQCTHFTWYSGTCYLKRFNSAATATSLSGAVCGWINRNGPGPSPGPSPGSYSGITRINILIYFIKKYCPTYNMHNWIYRKNYPLLGLLQAILFLAGQRTFHSGQNLFQRWCIS